MTGVLVVGRVGDSLDLGPDGRVSGYILGVGVGVDGCRTVPRVASDWGTGYCGRLVSRPERPSQGWSGHPDLLTWTTPPFTRGGLPGPRSDLFVSVLLGLSQEPHQPVILLWKDIDIGHSGEHT